MLYCFVIEYIVREHCFESAEKGLEIYVSLLVLLIFVQLHVLAELLVVADL